MDANLEISQIDPNQLSKHDKNLENKIKDNSKEVVENLTYEQVNEKFQEIEHKYLAAIKDLNKEIIDHRNNVENSLKQYTQFIQLFGLVLTTAFGMILNFKITSQNTISWKMIIGMTTIPFALLLIGFWILNWKRK